MAEYKGASREGQRAQALLKKREKMKEDMEARKKKIAEKNKIGDITSKFSSQYDVVEQQLKESTIGLVTLDEMKAKRDTLVREHEKQLAAKLKIDEEESKKSKREKKREKQKQAATLSFGLDEEEDEDEEPAVVFKKKKLGKNPDVDTSFLPDREREEMERKERERLGQEWIQKQEKIKNEEIQITYSYWDGSGHRRTTKMKKGNSISQFLQKCIEELRKDFAEFRTITTENLMYIKEDLIMPQHYSFYDFIVNKARGKSGPLFSFDVHEDVRISSDASVEKDESHAGKVVLRTWYERNKHIFPASRWEPYDPEKKWDKYTISDTPKNT
ncbi:protein FAM50A-A [Exaiptasia diaphana]|uniref:FAM50A/XAP5 C-terminal domain-containing protein n=1 Tax=Exaiptasia diaphana TaxID=2652724 RepID=A0A913XNL2_EXADI|nr:protein FAM50A-A [Exaiptasia diaphana]KXJ25444.1 Protein FAM50-like [Exaiptasia diaphana]